MRASLVLGLAILLSAASASAQDATTSGTTVAPPQRDLQAVTLAAQAYQAMVGLTPLQNIVIQGSVTRIAGSDEEMGSANIELAGGQASRMVLSLTGGQRQRVYNQQSGAWAGPDGAWHAQALHNCWIGGGWVFPAFLLAAALNDTSYSIIYPGLTQLDGGTFTHLVIYRSLSIPSAAAARLIQHLSRLDFYLDPATGLPAALEFMVHPDDDAGLDILVQIHFSNYQNVNGVQVPFHIQKLVEGSLALDVTLSGAQINSSLQASDFAVPATTDGGAR
jgi:hypothetical protein